MSTPGLPLKRTAAGHEAARPTADAAWHELHRIACLPYQRAGRFAWHFARGKLGRDPAFRSLLEHGHVPPRARVLDIGCGQALLGSLLRTVDAQAARGGWPAAWPAAPVGAAYTGIELMPKDVARARHALGDGAALVCADMRSVAFPPSDVVLILDVLHYVPIAAQDTLLQRIRECLQPHGRLLLRVSDAARARRYALSQWVDRAVTLVRGHSAAPTYGRTVQAWVAALSGLGFRVQPVPMSRGTPFVNVLLVADLGAAE